MYISLTAASMFSNGAIIDNACSPATFSNFRGGTLDILRLIPTIGIDISPFWFLTSSNDIAAALTLQNSVTVINNKGKVHGNIFFATVLNHFFLSFC